jgi:hypothetical protein
MVGINSYRNDTTVLSHKMVQERHGKTLLVKNVVDALERKPEYQCMQVRTLRHAI